MRSGELRPRTAKAVSACSGPSSSGCSGCRTAIVDHANRVRPNPSGLKVGGHQASSASMVSIMTSLWFGHLQRGRPGIGQAARVAGAARDQLPARRAGRVLPDRRCARSAACRATRAGPRTPIRRTTRPGRWASARPPRSGGRWPAGTSTRQFGGAGTGRQYSLVGDAELDEGAVWEAVLDPMVAELGEVVWIVDLNRQSLDRVVPDIGTPRLQGMFAAAGWQVLTVKYGRLLNELFARPGGGALRGRIDAMTNPEYQRLLRCTAGRAARPAARRRAGRRPDPAAARRRRRRGAARGRPQPGRPRPRRARPTRSPRSTTPGRRSSSPTPSRDTAWPCEGHPQNHSALLTRGSSSPSWRTGLGVDPGQPVAEVP